MAPKNALCVSTHLAHKHEQAINLETGAIVGVTLHGGAAGDTKTIEKTLTTADANLAEVRQEGSQAAREQVAERVEEVVADRGYHSNGVLTKLEEVEVRSYIPEPARGRRNWKKKKEAERDVRLPVQHPADAEEQDVACRWLSDDAFAVIPEGGVPTPSWYFAV